MAFLTMAMAAGTWAAPFSEVISFKQPDGTTVQLSGRGDEFYANFETLDGYTVLFDEGRKAYCFAKEDGQGRLISTGVEVHLSNPAALGLPKHLRESAAVRRQQARARRQEWEQTTQVGAAWKAKKAAMHPEGAAKGAYPPVDVTLGTKIGLCLLIDFEDDPATIPQSEISAFCNGDNFTGFGNNGSVKKYFQDVSNNRLTYSNVVTLYIRIPNSLHNKAYYNNTASNCATQARKLITDAFTVMKALPNYNSEIVPTFNNLTVNEDNEVVAFNIFYAGGNGGVWSKGLWPHCSAVYPSMELSPGGKTVWIYQMCNIGSSLSIGTFCHENGHMLCDFPDIYDYDYDSIGGAGDFCLMSYGSHAGGGKNPVQVCAYLKRAAGWGYASELTRGMGITGVLTATAGTNFNHFYRFEKPGMDTEYFILENRQLTGRDASLPGAGIAIWHIDELGDGDNQSLEYNNTHDNYEVTLVQADNEWHFENNDNYGDSKDLYYQGNPASGYANEFSSQTAPKASWWDGSDSGAVFKNFSANGNNMTFTLGDGQQTNDLCSAAFLIAGSNYTNTQSTADATATDDPTPSCGTSVGKGVWYVFTAPDEGDMVIDTIGSDFDTVLALYSGDCDSLVSVACDDNGGGDDNAKIAKATAAGATYYILAGGNNGASGNLTLHLKFTAALPPKILTQPVSQVVLAGATVDFSVTASGTAPLSYQWRKNGASIGGATAATYSISNVQPSQKGNYSVLVSNPYGAVVSSNAVLTVGGQPNDFCSGAIPFSGTSVTTGQSTVNAISTFDPAPSCGNLAGAGVWYVYTPTSTGKIVVDTIGSDYDTVLAIYSGSCESLAPVTCNDDYNGAGVSQATVYASGGVSYYILVGGYNSATGNLVLHLGFTPGFPPAITGQPVGQTVTLGSPASFTVRATGSQVLSYQWNKNGATIAGATSSVFSIASVQTNDLGSYSVVITNGYGSVTSANALLASTLVANDVCSGAILISTPAYSNIQPTADASSTGDPSLACGNLGRGVWYKYVPTSSGKIVVDTIGSSFDTMLGIYSGSCGALTPLACDNNSGGNLAARAISSVSPGTNYYILAGGNNGATGSLVFHLAFGTAPVIVGQPASQTVSLGAAAALNVTAVGSTPLSYQWQKNGVIVGGATGSALAISNAQTNDAGTYSVTVTNSFGSATSLDAVLTLTNITGLTLSPVDRGWYTDAGDHDPANQNYSVGESSSGDRVMRNWFVFEVPVFSGPISKAELLINCYTNVTPSGSETYVLHDVTTPITQLVAGGSGLTAVYADLGNGSVYGTREILRTESGKVVTLTLGPEFIQALTAAQGSKLALGGSISSLDASRNNEWLFGYSASALGDVQLRLNSSVVEAPPTIVRQPTAQGVPVGSAVTFSAGVSGSAPLIYKWRKNGSAIAGATGSAYSIATAQLADAGTYSVVVSNNFGVATSSNAILAVTSMPLAAEFQIIGLVTNNGFVTEHLAISGDDRGGIAASGAGIFYSGDNSTASFSISDLSGGATLGRIFDALVGDVQSGKIYSLANGSTPLSNQGGTVTTLLEHDSNSGFLTGSSISLSSSIELPANNGNVGIFAGYGRIVLHTGARVYEIRVPSGLVIDQGSMASPTHQNSETWAYWGVAENFGGKTHLVYVRDAQSVVRTTVPAGTTTTIATFTNLADMASITVSVPYGRWYFHHEGLSEFGGSQESLGFAQAAFRIQPVAASPAAILNQAGMLKYARNGSFEFSFSGTPGCIYQVQSSADLKNWNTLRFLTLTNAIGTVSDTTRPGGSFYRVRLVP